MYKNLSRIVENSKTWKSGNYKFLQLSFSNNYFSVWCGPWGGCGSWVGLLYGSSDKYIKFSQLYNKKIFQSKSGVAFVKRQKILSIFSTCRQNIFRGKLLRLKKQFFHPLYSFINVYSFTSFKITDFLLYCNASLYPIRILRTWRFRQLLRLRVKSDENGRFGAMWTSIGNFLIVYSTNILIIEISQKLFQCRSELIANWPLYRVGVAGLMNKFSKGSRRSGSTQTTTQQVHLSHKFEYFLGDYFDVNFFLSKVSRAGFYFNLSALTCHARNFVKFSIKNIAFHRIIVELFFWWCFLAGDILDKLARGFLLLLRVVFAVDWAGR